MFGKKNKEELDAKYIEEKALPVKPGDPALVVDLPDGQKLILGQIEPGTVIEVATWRGTGRPDSRTTRLLLGAAVNEQNQQKAIKAPKTKNVEENYSIFSRRKTHAEIANEITGEIPVVKKELVAGKHGVSPVKTGKKKIKSISLAVASIAALFVIVANNGVLNFQTVDLGITTSLGGPESIVAITQKTNQINAGDVVVIELPTKKEPQKLLAKVSALSNGQVLLQANGIQYQIENPEITGKVRLVLPFLGSVLKLV